MKMKDFMNDNEALNYIKCHIENKFEGRCFTDDYLNPMAKCINEAIDLYKEYNKDKGFTNKPFEAPKLLVVPNYIKIDPTCNCGKCAPDYVKNENKEKQNMDCDKIQAVNALVNNYKNKKLKEIKNKYDELKQKTYDEDPINKYVVELQKQIDKNANEKYLVGTNIKSIKSMGVIIYSKATDDAIDVLENYEQRDIDKLTEKCNELINLCRLTDNYTEINKLLNDYGIITKRIK